MKTLDASLAAGFAVRPTVEQAKKDWAAVRVECGFKPTTPKLLSKNNQKLKKNGEWGLSLLPHRLAGVGNLCPWSTQGCRETCINLSGNGFYPKIQQGRKARTVFLVKHPGSFAVLLEQEIMALPKGAALRLNVFSDLRWETIFPEIFTARPDIQFYDYRKGPVDFSALPSNYSITRSASETWSDRDIVDAVAREESVAVVLRVKRDQPLPDTWNGMPVIDGDKSDARYEDKPGTLVGLRAKGKARSSKTPFVRSV